MYPQSIDFTSGLNFLDSLILLSSVIVSFGGPVIAALLLQSKQRNRLILAGCSLGLFFVPYCFVLLFGLLGVDFGYVTLYFVMTVLLVNTYILPVINAWFLYQEKELHFVKPISYIFFSAWIISISAYTLSQNGLI